MKFTISAWDVDGKGIVKREGPLGKRALFNGGYVQTDAEKKRRTRRDPLQTRRRRGLPESAHG